MELIVDATILFCGLIGTGVTKDIIFSDLIKLYAPEHLFDEFTKHKSRIKELSGLSSKDFNILFNKLQRCIEVVPREKFDSFLIKADSLVTDSNDVPYLSLALFLHIPVWSEDPHFKKQSSVKVFTTRELVNELKCLGFIF